jgi:hypothetical protein
MKKSNRLLESGAAGDKAGTVPPAFKKGRKRRDAMDFQHLLFLEFLSIRLFHFHTIRKRETELLDKFARMSYKHRSREPRFRPDPSSRKIAASNRDSMGKIPCLAIAATARRRSAAPRMVPAADFAGVSPKPALHLALEHSSIT